MQVFRKKRLTFVAPYVIILMVIQKGGAAMSPKMGRPTQSPKTHETRIRMSDEDIRMLNACVSKTGKTKSDVIREGIREVYNKINESVPTDQS